MISRTEKNKKTHRQIQTIESIEKSRKILSVTVKVILILIAVLGISYFLLRYVGNYGIIVKEKVVYNEKIPDSFNGLKIIHFTDLHYGTTVKEKQISILLEKINNIQPDLIIFTGDLIDEHYKLNNEEKELIIKFLNSLDSKLGKYSAKGDEDAKNFDNIMKETDFIVLDNNNDLVYNESYNPILLVGIGSSISKNMDISKAFNGSENNNNEMFTISIMHEPDNIDEMLKEYSVDLALAGHSLNGQIKLPFIRFTSMLGANKYYEEEYNVGNTKLLISGGLGTVNLPFRLFNHPSFNFIRLKK